jgi:putative transposase
MEKIVEYYSLCFQIEFNFRDAKQYFGLADFKNYKQTQVTNAVNLSFFMCNFAYILIEYFKEHFGIKNMSILDLKAFFRAEKIGNEALKLKKQVKKALPFLNIEEIFKHAKFQSVNF